MIIIAFIESLISARYGAKCLIYKILFAPIHPRATDIGTTTIFILWTKKLSFKS